MIGADPTHHVVICYLFCGEFDQGLVLLSSFSVAIYLILSL